MQWPTKIEVHKDLVPLLSRQTYADFYQVLREFINNSYDADATRVDVSFNLHEQFFEILDNGNGMTPEHFVNNFLTIALPKGVKEKTELGRSVIGQFGVGFLSAAQYCDRLIIESSTAKSEVAFEAVIDCKKFFEKGDRSKIEVGDIPVYGRDYKKPSNYNKHYTKVTLKGLTDETEILFDRSRQLTSKATIKGWSGLDALKWQLEQTLPLEYPKNSESYSDYLTHDWGTPLEVYLNGIKLFRNKLPGHIVDHSEGIEQVGNVKFKYIIMTPWRPVIPYELVGLQIRLNNVGIGLPFLFGISTRTGRFYMTTKWICGEIQIIEGLENQLKLDRTAFAESDDYNEFYHFFRKKIISNSNKIEKRRPRKQRINKIKKEILKNQEKLIQKKTVKVTPSQLISKSNKPPKSLIKKLEDNLGDGVYTVEKKSYSGDIIQSPLTIDAKEKKVKIVEDHPAYYEHVLIDDMDFILDYDDFDLTEDDSNKISVCRIDKKNKKIFLNKNFKLFQDKLYGNFYKQFFSIMEYTKEKYPKTTKVQDFIKKAVLKIYFEERG